MDMANLTNRDGLYYVRFIIPKDRWQDAGKVLGSRTGIRKDILKSLQTRTHKDALRLRDAALEAIRKQLNRRLVDAGLLSFLVIKVYLKSGSFLHSFWANLSPDGVRHFLE